MVLAPAVVGIPGGLELIIILVIFILLFGVPLTLLLILGYKVLDRSPEATADEERIAELESEVQALRERIEEDDE
ncbi:MAG: preprotein translocase subunit TatA [Halanaeroarchaeum sp.]